MHKRRFQHQKIKQKEMYPESPHNIQRNRLRWTLNLVPPLLAVGFLSTLIGAAAHPVGGSALLGAFLGLLIGDVGLVMLVLLVKMMRLLNVNRAEINPIINKRPSRLIIFGWCLAMLIAATIGAALGYILFPHTLSTLLRIFFGTLIGTLGLLLLTSFLINPMGFLSEIIKGFIEEGCFFLFSCFSLFWRWEQSAAYFSCVYHKRTVRLNLDAIKRF